MTICSTTQNWFSLTHCILTWINLVNRYMYIAWGGRNPCHVAMPISWLEFTNMTKFSSMTGCCCRLSVAFSQWCICSKFCPIVFSGAGSRFNNPQYYITGTLLEVGKIHVMLDANSMAWIHKLDSIFKYDGLLLLT